MEVIGLVASVVQIANAALQLKEFWSDIRSAPRDVLDLVEEVSLTADLIADIQYQQHAVDFAGADLRSWTKCLDLFSKCAESMKRLVTDLHATFRSHKRTGSLRLFLGAHDIHRCKERLQRIQSLMLSAQQVYAMLYAKISNTLIIRELRSLSSQQRRMIELPYFRDSSSGPEPRIRHLAVAGEKDDSPHNHLDIDSTNATRNCTSTKSFRLSLPTWILRRTFEILLNQSNNSWGVTFRSYNRLGPDAPVFTAASCGKWDVVRQMFSTGEASPFDVDVWNRTLLNVAALRADPDACYMLVEQGLDPGRESGWSLFTPITELAVYRPQNTENEITNLLRIFRLFARSSTGAFCDTNGRLESRFYEWPPSVVSAICEYVFPNYAELDPIERISMAFSGRTNIDSVKVLLGSNLKLQQAFVVARDAHMYSNHISLLCNLAGELGAVYQEKPDPSRYREPIMEVIKFEAGDTTLHYFSSPLYRFIWGYLSVPLSARFRTSHESWNERFTAIARMWLGHLAQTGADLDRYGKAERAYSHHLWSSTSLSGSTFAVNMSRDRSMVFRLQHLTTGPNIEDWNLFVVPTTQHLKRRSHNTSGWIDIVNGNDEYEMSGAFWHQVENPELFNIPGAFIDDENLFRPRTNRKPGWGRFQVYGPVL